MLGHDSRQLAAIFAGGAIGALVRAALVEAWARDPNQWPWATFIANLVAVALLGFVITRLQERLPLSGYRRPLWGTGLCGGLSTFSTMQLELLRMIEHDAFALAAAYVIASTLGGLVVVQATTAMVRRVRIRV